MKINEEKLKDEFIELVGQTNSFTKALEIQQKQIIERNKKNNEKEKSEHLERIL